MVSPDRFYWRMVFRSSGREERCAWKPVCRLVLTCSMSDIHTDGVLGGVEGSIEAGNGGGGGQERFYI